MRSILALVSSLAYAWGLLATFVAVVLSLGSFFKVGNGDWEIYSFLFFQGIVLLYISRFLARVIRKSETAVSGPTSN